MNKKEIYIFLSVIVLLFFTGWWYSKMLSIESHSQTTTPSSDGASTTTSGSTTTTGITYVNNQYGFTFSLPADWTGYTIVTQSWNGMPVNGPSGNITATSGPEILIRNPHWTKATPYQDIPIMIFTHTEWNEIQSEDLAVSAAPFPPSELGQNAHYVFALPPRYNYAFPAGWQEVETIMQGNPLQAK